MPAKKLSSSHRRAAAIVLMQLASESSSRAHSLRQLAASYPPASGTTGCGLGLTNPEIDLLNKLADKEVDRGDLLYRLGWRLQGNTHLLKKGVKR